MQLGFIWLWLAIKHRRVCFYSKSILSISKQKRLLQLLLLPNFLDSERDIGHQKRQISTELLTGPVVSYQTRFCLDSCTPVRLHVSQGLSSLLPIASRGFHCIACRATEDSSFRRICLIQPHIIRYSIGPINVKSASEATVHKDLKFGGDWFGDFPSAWTI